jgi:hypothetical protein
LLIFIFVPDQVGLALFFLVSENFTLEMVAKRVDSAADAMNIYEASRRYTDRNARSTEFPAFDVTIEKIPTMLLLLQSDESDVVEKV